MSSTQEAPVPAPQQKRTRAPKASSDKEGEARPERKTQGRRNQNGSNTANGTTGRRSPANGAKKDDRKPRPQKNLRTLMVSNLSLEDLDMDNRNLAEHYKDQRIQNVVTILAESGEIDAVEKHIEENTVLVTFAKSDDANKALKKLSNRKALTESINKVRDAMEARRMPGTLAPPSSIRIGWADKQVDTGKVISASTDKAAEGAKSQKKVKAAPAGTVAAAMAPAKAPESEKKEKKKREPKAKVVAKTEEAPKAEPETKPKPTVDRAALAREAELAKHKEHLGYIVKQKKHLHVQLTSERDRCNMRDAHIHSLAEELRKLQTEVAHLEKKLGKEREYKQDSELLMTKLSEELAHLDEEEKQLLEKIEAATPKTL